jgi:hypothetical protein
MPTRSFHRWKLTGEKMPSQIDLSDDDVAFLLTVLRNSSQPVTTQQLIDAVRNRSLATASEPAEGGQTPS